MKPNNFNEFFKEYSISIPSYQRVYTWGKEEIDFYIHDLKEDISKPRPTNLGVIYYENTNTTNNTYEIIDGQQRLTTSVLILCTLALQQERFQKAREFARMILETKTFSSEIEELQNIYNGFYTFINAGLINSEIPFESLCNKFVVYEKDSEEPITVKENDLLSAMTLINQMISIEDESLLNKLIDQILDIDFYLIKNPYDNDPITIFERLNNRGKELSFLSMTKIKIYEFFEKKIKDLEVEDAPGKALKFMKTYTEIIYSIFNDSHHNYRIENREGHIEDSLVEYLIIYNRQIISKKKRTEKLNNFNTFLESEIDLKIHEVDNPFDVLSGLLHKFLIFSSILLIPMNNKIGKYSVEERTKVIYYLNDNKYTDRYDQLCEKPKGFLLEKLHVIDRLDIINLKKFKFFCYYILTEVIVDPMLLPSNEEEQSLVLDNLFNHIFKWTAVNYTSYVGADLVATFREWMNLFDFIKYYLDYNSVELKIKELSEKFNKDTSAFEERHKDRKIKEFKEMVENKEYDSKNKDKVNELYKMLKFN